MSTDVKVWTGEEVRQLRFRMRLNQAEFAARLDTWQGQVSEWERGVNRIRRFATLRALDALDAESRQTSTE